MKPKCNDLMECINYQISIAQEKIKEKARIFFSNEELDDEIDVGTYTKKNDIKFTKMLKSHIKYTWIEINKLMKDTNTEANEGYFLESERLFEPYLVRIVESYLSKRDEYLKDNNISKMPINYNEELFFTEKEVYQKRIIKGSYIEMRLAIVKNKVKKSPTDLKNQIISNLIASIALIISIVTLVITVSSK